MKRIFLLVVLMPMLLLAQPKQSTLNSRYTVLGSGATFTGTWEQIKGDYNSVTVIVRSDKSSATNGLKIELSKNGVDINAFFIFSYTANDTTTNRYTVPLTASYFRVVYTNTTAVQTTFSLTTVLNNVFMPNIDAFGRINTNNKNSWDWVKSFTQYSDTVKVNGVAVDILTIGGTEWAKVTVRGKSSTDSLYVGFGTTAPTVWTKIIGTSSFVTEKLNHTYFTNVYLKGYGVTGSVRNYEVTIEAF